MRSEGRPGISINGEVYERLREYCRGREISMAALVERIIERDLAANAPAPQDPQSSTASPCAPLL